MKEHQSACQRGETDKSAIAEHCWKEHHPINWEGATVVDRARRRQELCIKEALHIQLTPEEQRFNKDVGLELPDCWIATIKSCKDTPTSYRSPEPS